MTDESYGFTAARARLEEIVTQVRKKDTSLEKSLDLLEEGVRLANICTEQIDHADWSADEVPVAGAAESTEAEEAEGADAGGDTITVVEDVVVVDETGEVVAEIVEVAEFEVSEQADDADFASADEAWADDSGFEATADEDAEEPAGA